MENNNNNLETIKSLELAIKELQILANNLRKKIPLVILRTSYSYELKGELTETHIVKDYLINSKDYIKRDGYTIYFDDGVVKPEFKKISYSNLINEIKIFNDRSEAIDYIENYEAENIYDGYLETIYLEEFQKDFKKFHNIET